MQASRQVHPQPEPSSETVLSPLDDKMDVRGNGVRDRRVNPEKFNTMTKASDRQIQDKVLRKRQSQVIVHGLEPI